MRLSARATSCPFCAGRTVAASTERRGPRRRHWSNHAGRWLRRLAAVVLLFVLGLVALITPFCLLIALLTDEPILSVLTVGLMTAGGVLTLFLGAVALAVVVPFVWLLLLPLAYWRGASVLPVGAVSARSEPAPRRLALGHRLVRVANTVRAWTDDGRLSRWTLVVLNGALLVAVLITWIRGLPWVDGWAVFGGGLMISFMLGFGMGFFGVAVQEIAKWLVSPPGLEPPRAELGDDVELVLADRRRADRVEGTLRARREPLLGPVSGARCVAARVRGMVDGRQVDDAHVTELVVDTDDGPVALVGDDVIVAIEGFSEAVDALVDDRWLAARGLATRDVAVTEAWLEEGARVVVHGRAERALAPSAAYRGTQRDRVVALHADAGPILIERAT